MNIQAEKLKLVQMILDTDNPNLLSAIKRIFSQSTKTDFWDTLSQAQQNEILEAIVEIENGETVSYDEFIKKHR
jgi:O6-methylguanine-DNA--protein-cysteine methyltransferase